MKTKDEILAELTNFYGTENYHRWSTLFSRFVLTDGAKFIAEECEAYWLMDLIASHLRAYRLAGFAVVKMSVKKGKGVVRIEDGDGNILAQQTVRYTDFPLDEITLYITLSVTGSDLLWVIMVPSEY